MTTLIQRLGWSSVAALTADGEKYTDYMASLQVSVRCHQEGTDSLFRMFYSNT